MKKQCLNIDNIHNDQLVGDPVDTLTGTVFEKKMEFRLIGPLEFKWIRRYDSSKNHRLFALGWGHTHDYDRRLYFDADGISYEEPLGKRYGFPPLFKNGAIHQAHGYTLERVSPTCFRLHKHALPSMEFNIRQANSVARLSRLYKDENQILFFYDVSQRLVRIVDSLSRSIRVNESDSGLLFDLSLEAYKDKPEVTLIRHEFDERGNLLHTANHLGHGYSFLWNEENRLVRRSGRMRFSFYYIYDEEGRCIKSSGDDRNFEVDIEYSVPGTVTKVVKSDGGEWVYFFNEDGGLTQIQDPLGGTQKFVRDDAGRIVEEIDTLGNSTKMIYDASGEPRERITPLGHRIAQPEDPNTPDPKAHRVAANPAEFEYGRLMDLDSIVLPRETFLQALWLPQEITKLANCVCGPNEIVDSDRPYAIKPLGTLWWPNPKRGWRFNDLGKLVEQYDQHGNRRSWTYNASGNIKDYIDFDNQHWHFDYGNWQYLYGIKNPLGIETRFSYTTEGNVASCKDAGGTLSEYAYDQKNSLTKIRRHDRLKEIYERDTEGNLIRKLDGNEKELLRFEIGPANLPVKRILVSGDVHGFSYDAQGRYISLTTKKDSIELSYDFFGNRTSETRNGQAIEYRYSAPFKPLSLTLFDKFQIQFEWENKDQLVICDPMGEAYKVRLLKHGLIETRFGNGCREVSQYDELGRCQFKHANRINSRPWARKYRWSGEGRLNEVGDSAFGGAKYHYDGAHRLVKREIAGRSEDFVFDFADNLLKQPGLDGVAMDSGNRVKAAQGFLYEYNIRNHVATRKTSDEQVQYHYHYDSRDQLNKLETPRGIFEAEYDPLGRRTRKIWNGEVTEYYWHSDQLIAEVSPLGKLRIYVYADPLAQSPRYFIDYDSVDSNPEAGRRYYILTDQIGTPRLIEDEKGIEVWRARCEPFGKARIEAESGFEFNLRFPGHYFDSEIELHYNRFRYYDPVTARYIQSDPWGIAGGTNLYAYCQNPLLQVDVRGLGDETTPPSSGGDDEESTNKQNGDDGPMSSADAEALARQRNAEFRDHLDSEIAAGNMSKKDAGPVVATVVDRETGEAFSGHNNRNGDPPENLHPILQSRLDALEENPQHPSSPGSHAEVYALNDALQAREGSGRPVSEDQLGEFTQVSEWRRGSGEGRMTAGDDAPRCGNCQEMTRGVDNRSGDAPLRPPGTW